MAETLARLNQRTEASIIEGFSLLASLGILRDGRDALVEARFLHGLIDGFSIHAMIDPDCMSSDEIRALLTAHLSQVLDLA